jgi:mRNA interferase MazF
MSRRILCQVTSRSYADPRAVEITDQDFDHGSLRDVSYARPAKLFAAHQGLFVAKPGELKPAALQSIIQGVVSLLHNTT